MSEEQKKIYVTGAAGMIGSNLVKRLVDEDFFVIGIDNFSRSDESRISDLVFKKNFKFFKEDIKDFNNSWSEDIGSNDTIIHLADIVAGIGYVFQNQWSIFNENLAINSSIGKIIAEKNPNHLIYVGTACSYPQNLQRSIDDSVLKENDKFPADPESAYGWSKLIGDIEYKYLSEESDLIYTNLDLHNVYGFPTDTDPATAQVIPSLIKRALENEELEIWGDGSQGRGFLEVNDVVDSILLAIKKEYNGSIMIGPEECSKISDLAEIIIKNPLTKSTKISYDLSKPIGDIGRYADSSIARKILGWEPKISLESGINSLIKKISELK